MPPNAKWLRRHNEFLSTSMRVTSYTHFPKFFISFYLFPTFRVIFNSCKLVLMPLRAIKSFAQCLKSSFLWNSIPLEKNVGCEHNQKVGFKHNGNPLMILRGIYYLTGIQEDLYDSYTTKIYAYTNGMNIPVTFKWNRNIQWIFDTYICLHILGCHTYTSVVSSFEKWK